MELGVGIFPLVGADFGMTHDKYGTYEASVGSASFVEALNSVYMM